MAPYEEILFLAAVLGFAGFIGWLVVRFAAERARERERRARVVEAQIEKFADADEFIAFARSEAGLEWIRADSGERRALRGTMMLGATGAVSFALGLALLAWAAWMSGVAEPEAVLDGRWWGVVLAGLGVGLLAAMALLLRLARAWGLGPARPDGRRADAK
jgi:hypothetical protein